MTNLKQITQAEISIKLESMFPMQAVQSNLSSP